MPTNDTTSDELLALRLQRGDSGAIDELVQRYYVAIRRYLYRLTGCQDALSEELTQDTMFHLIQGIRGYNAARPFRPWLYTIATNLFRNHCKRAEQRFRQDNDEVTEAIIANMPDERELPMEEAWQAEETTRRLSAELYRLPEMHSR